MERSQHCAKSAEELKSEVCRLGGDPGLPSDVHKLIERQYQGAIANHDLVRGVRDSFSAAA